jgi:hypothetical protein
VTTLHQTTQTEVVVPRTPKIDRYDGILLGLVTIGLLALLVAQGADLRRFSNAIGVAVFGLLIWRLVTTWSRLTVLEHALTMLLAASPLVAAMASLYLARVTTDLPPNPWLWLVVAHRAACLVLVVYWNRWLGRRVSPFRRTPAGDHDQRRP